MPERSSSYTMTTGPYGSCVGCSNQNTPSFELPWRVNGVLQTGQRAASAFVVILHYPQEFRIEPTDSSTLVREQEASPRGTDPRTLFDGIQSHLSLTNQRR